jgi:anti-sigma B factor antagonist
MDVEERQLGDVMILDLNGRLTLGDNSVRLKDKINSVLQDGSLNILLNLGDVSYIDSGGLGQLISSFKGVERENGQLKLFNLGKKSKELLAMTKLVTVFDTFDTEHEALASFEDGPA